MGSMLPAAPFQTASALPLQSVISEAHQHRKRNVASQ